MTTNTVQNTGRGTPSLKGQRCFEPGDVVTNSSRTSPIFAQIEVPSDEQGPDKGELFATSPDDTLDLQPLDMVTVLYSKTATGAGRDQYEHALCLRSDNRISWYRRDDDLRLASELTEADKTGERMGR